MSVEMAFSRLVLMMLVLVNWRKNVPLEIYLNFFVHWSIKFIIQIIEISLTCLNLRTKKLVLETV